MENKDSNPEKNSRRSFIKGSTLALAGFYIVPRHVLGGVGFVAPSDRLRVASIGVGGMGAGDVSGVFRSGKVDMIALCDVDDTRAKKAGRIILKQATTRISVQCWKRRKRILMQ